jgi:hypothetical protein
MKRTTPCDLIYKVQFGMAQSHKLTLTIYLFILVFFMIMDSMLDYKLDYINFAL